MSDALPEKQEQTTTRPLAVASVLSSDRVVINKGSSDGVRIGQRFLIYECTDDEIEDPVTHESLGFLEEPKGTGRIVSVQDRIAVPELCRYLTPDPVYRPARCEPYLRSAIADYREELKDGPGE